MTALAFDLPFESEATTPPEARGLARDEVRMLVVAPDELAHRQVRDLPTVLHPGDLLVVNTSATLPAALPGILNGAAVRVHLSTPLGADRWVVELRTEMHQDAFPGEDISDRRDPSASVPGLLALIDGDQPSGRYEARAVISEPRTR